MSKFTDEEIDNYSWSSRHMTLAYLIKELRQIDPNRRVRSGFGSPHSDRGYYSDVAFEPVAETTIGEMLKHAESAVGDTFTGWKGGDFTMSLSTEVFVGEYGECGTPITDLHIAVWRGDYEYVGAKR